MIGGNTNLVHVLRTGLYMATNVSLFLL